MSQIPAYDGPSQAVGTYQGQVFMLALPLSSVQDAPLSAADLVPFTLELPAVPIDWLSSGSTSGYGALSTLVGQVSWDLRSLPAPATLVGVAVVGDVSSDQVVTVIALPTPLALVPGDFVASLQITLISFDDLAGD